MEERLQKYMSRCGVASRRKCEELIADGLVEVNGETIREPGVKIDPARDRVRVDGKNLRLEQPAYFIHHKVKGVTTTVSDDLGRRTVMDCLPDIRERVYPVGRLDKDSEGLLVLTNDGELANYLTHPAHGVGKTYRVVAEGRVPEETLQALAEKGIRLGPVLIRPSRVELVRYDNDNTIVLISVAEGINREVRRIFAALGHEVKRLLRTKVGPLELAGLARGATRLLTAKEIAVLKKGMAGMKTEEEAAAFPAGSAKTRKPTGPRGRTGKTTAKERRGKPDPRKAAAKRDGVVVDDWRKATGPGRRTAAGRNKAAAPAKPLRTLRPAKRPVDKQAAHETARQENTAKTTPYTPKSVGHPLVARAAKPVDTRTGQRPSGPREERRPSAPRGDKRPSAPRDERRSSAPRGDRRPSGPRADKRPAAARSGVRKGGNRHA